MKISFFLICDYWIVTFKAIVDTPTKFELTNSLS